MRSEVLPGDNGRVKGRKKTSFLLGRPLLDSGLFYFFKRQKKKKKKENQIVVTT